MESLFDLPAHVFFVHAPVVLMPLIAAVAVVVMPVPSWRRRVGWPLAGATVVLFVATLLATSSGEAFDDILRDNIGNLAARHRRLGEQTRGLVFAFMVLTVVAVVADAAVRRRRTTPTWVPRVASVAAVLSGVAAVVATIWMIRTGHEGARITWSGVIPEG